MVDSSSDIQYMHKRLGGNRLLNDLKKCGRLPPLMHNARKKDKCIEGGKNTPCRHFDQISKLAQAEDLRNSDF